jgi:hypothetical protein
VIEGELVVDAGDVKLPATLSLPEKVRGGIVTMHPAISRDRDNFLLAHLEDEAAAVDDGVLVVSGGQPAPVLRPLKARSMTLRPP